MQADQIDEITRRNGQLAAYAKQVHPDIDNVFCGDSLLVYDKLLDFRNDARFITAIETVCADLPRAMDHILYKNVIWRTHVQLWAARHALHLDGDFVEMGVFQGYSAAVLAHYLDFAAVPKTWWLYDTFDGIAPEDENRLARNEYLSERYKEQGLFEVVKRRFAAYPNVRVIQGRIPDVLAEACPERISFLHIDMTAARPERDGLAAVFERLTPGSVVVFDDYGRIKYRENHQLIDDFLNPRRHFVLELPTGQGLFIRH